MITTILFDLGGVLLTDGTKALIGYLYETYGMDKEKLGEIFRAGPLIDAYRANTMTRAEYWDAVEKEVRLPESKEEIEKRWYNGYNLIIETKEIIQQLREKYKIYFLSDNVKHRADYVNEKFNILNIFHGGTYSHETKFRKPQPQVYQFALKKMGVPASEVLFIDDKEGNLLPAKELGMTTLLFISPEKLEEDLQKMHLL